MLCLGFEVEPPWNKGDGAIWKPRGPQSFHVISHACHANGTLMSRSATHATQMERECHQVPAHCHKYHTCHANGTSMSPSATPATQSSKRMRMSATPAPQNWSGSPSATPATQSASQCRQVPRHACHAKRTWCHHVLRLPRKTKVDVAKYHACHAKYHGVTCDLQRLNAPPEAFQCRKRDACHAKCKSVSPSATPATRKEGGCRQVPRRPRKVPRHRRL